MSADSCGRKIVDLRVLDLKEELEKRSLDVTGNKNALIARLQEALKGEGKNPDTYLFEPLDKRATTKKVSNNTKEKTNGNVNNKANIKEEEENEELVDEVGTVDEEFEGSQEDCNNDANMNDNEESINLTIEEDEQKLLHAQAQDDKVKKTDRKAIKEEGGDSKDGDKEDDMADENAKDDMNNGNDKKKESSGDDNEKTKKDDSELKSSSKSTTSKDEKDKSTSKSKSSSSSSRNVWVSKLSKITRASDLKAIFSQFGKVIGAKVVTNTRTPGGRCYGYVTMNSSADASKCIQRLHRTELHGHTITVKSEIGTSSSGSKAVSSSISRDKKSSSKSREKAKSEDKDKKKDDKKSNEDAAAESATDTKKSESGDNPKTETVKREENRLSRLSRERNRARTSRNREREREREILSFQRLREERERLRVKEQLSREDERRRRDVRTRQREEEQHLRREREKLQLERARLEREKAELLRLERERQTLEREKIELERLELKRQQMKIMQSARVEEPKRPLKRPLSDRYGETNPKRPNTDRRFEAPPPPRFDTTVPSRGAAGNYERPPEKSAPPKRDDYKRDLDVPRHANNYQANPRENHKDNRYVEQDPRSNFRRADERDTRNTGTRPAYPERAAGSNSQWHNSGPPAIKSFAGSSMTSGGGGIANWPSKASDNSHWRPVESSQDRYDRTYNERSGGGSGSQYIQHPASRQNMFVGRPQERYGGQMSLRYENGKY